MTGLVPSEAPTGSAVKPPNALANALGLPADADAAAVGLWLSEYANAHTRRAYEREARRVLVWVRVSGLPLARQTLVSWTQFSEALARPDVASRVAATIADAALREEFVAEFAADGRSGGRSDTRSVRALIVVRRLLGWLRDHGYVQTIALPRERSRTRPREEQMRDRIASRSLSAQQIACIKAARDALYLTWATSPADARMLMVVTWLMATGARRQELASATTADFATAPDGSVYWRVHGKGAKSRDNAVTSEMMETWRRYRSSAGLSTALPPGVGEGITPLVLPLTSHEVGLPSVGPHGHVTGATVWLIVKEFVGRAAALVRPPSRDECSDEASFQRGLLAARVDRERLAGSSPHWFRHLLATTMMDAGIALQVVQRQLGHASITTTTAYQHVRDESARAAAEVAGNRLFRKD